MASKRNVKEISKVILQEKDSSQSSGESIAASTKWPKFLPLIVTAVAILVFGYLLIGAYERLSYVIEPVFVPLLISLALAYLLEPVVEWFEKFRFSRSNAAVCTILLAGLAVVLALLFIVPSFWSQLLDIGARLPEKVRAAASFVQGNIAALQERNPGLYDRISSKIAEFVQNPTGVTEPLLGFVKNSFRQVGSITASLLNLILIPLFVYYILADFKKLSELFQQAVPTRNRSVVSDLFRQVDAALRNFVRGQLLVCSAMAVIFVIGFILLGVPMGFTLGILSGFGHLIPYFGTAVSAVLVVGFTVLDKPDWWRIVAVIAMFPIVQSIEGFVLTPRILGEKLELHPFLVIAGVIIGHHLFGIIGIILAAPVMACAKVFIGFFFDQYLNSKYYMRKTSSS